MVMTLSKHSDNNRVNGSFFMELTPDPGESVGGVEKIVGS